MRANGTGQKRLTNNASQDIGPFYSPDGSRIAFTSDRDGSFGVYAMKVDGTATTKLGASGSDSYGSDWAAVISKGPGVPPLGVGRPALCPKATSPSVRCVRNSLGRLTMIGTSLSERFVGTAGPDGILSFAGNDLVNARGGKDRVSGGRGRDRLNGGPGNDRLEGNAGNDSLSGNSGRDRLFGGAGRDRLRGGSARDRLNCGPGTDRALGTSGDRVSDNCEQR